MVRAYVYHGNVRFWPNVRAAVLPRTTFKPILHLHQAETVLTMKDRLPKLRNLPVEVGGSGELVPEYLKSERYRTSTDNFWLYAFFTRMDS